MEEPEKNAWIAEAFGIKRKGDGGKMRRGIKPDDSICIH
jgi:hypothetical protein